MKLPSILLLAALAPLAACTAKEAVVENDDLPAEVDAIPTDEEALEAAQSQITEENADAEFDALAAEIGADVNDG